MAITTYYGLNTAPSGSVSGNPATERANFLAALAGSVTNYGFEDRTATDTPPFSFTNVGASGNITTSLTSDAAAVATVVSSSSGGMFNTTPSGGNYLRTREVANALNFSFSTPIAAMGFYLTDMVEATGTVELVLTPFGGGGTTTLTIISATQSSGSLVFFGFTDDATTYTSAKLTVTSGSTNTMGIDDIVTAQAAQILTATAEVLIEVPGPLGAPALLGIFGRVARVSCPGPLGAPRAYGWYDFSSQVEGQTPRYSMTLTPGDVVVPISSWQATLQAGAASYVQCVVPACADYVDAIGDADTFTITRNGTIGGSPFSHEMASATLENTQLSQGPGRYTALLTGHSDAFASDDGLPTSLDRPLAEVRSISVESNGIRARCAIDWLLRPGLNAVLNDVPFVVGSIGYYVSGTDQYMDVKEAE